MSELRPIDVTKPIETITGVPVFAKLETDPCNRILHVRENEAQWNYHVCDELGRLRYMPSLGPIIRNVQPTQEEIVAERLAKAATRPMQPTGLVAQCGEVVEAVADVLGGDEYRVMSRPQLGGLRVWNVTATGVCAVTCAYNLMPVKDFQDE